MFIFLFLTPKIPKARLLMWIHKQKLLSLSIIRMKIIIYANNEWFDKGDFEIQ